MKTTINGITFTLTTRVHQAPKDTNGNARWDIEVFANGDRYNKTVKGYRRVKNGYRVQAASHGYSVEQAIEDVLNAIIEKNQPKPIKTSNNKNTSEKIQAFILGSMSDDIATTPQDKLQATVKGFCNWYGPYEQKRTQNVQEAFGEWLSGLPSELYVSPYYSDMRELLNVWLGATEKEYSDDAIQKRTYQLVFREFQKLCKKYGVQDLYGRSNA